MVVAFGALAGLAFGALPVAVRFGLSKYADAEVGAMLIIGIGCVTVALLSVVSGEIPDLQTCWRFFLIGMLVPGAMQALAVRSVQAAGPSRASVVISTAPILSAALAISLLGEAARPAVIAGIVLIVVGCAALARERARPADFRRIGVAFASAAAAMLATRDNLVRWIAETHAVPAFASATASLFGGFTLLFIYTVSRGGRELQRSWRRAAVAFAVPGLLMGAGTASLYAAFARGAVTIVAPLNATSSLWTVVLAVALLSRRERVGRGLIIAAALVVAGGALIGSSA